MDARINEVVDTAYRKLALTNPSILKSVLKHNYFVSGIMINGYLCVLVDLTKNLDFCSTWESYCNRSREVYKTLCSIDGDYHC